MAKTRAAIRTAYFKLLEERDFGDITIAALAREAGIDRKTFYLHYGSVSDLADEIADEEARQLLTVCRDALRGGWDEAAPGRLFERLSIDLAENTEGQRRLIRHFPMEDWLRRIEQPLIDGIVEDEIWELDLPLDYVTLCVSYYCTGLMGMYRRWVLDDSEVPFEVLARLAAVAMFKGVSGAADLKSLCSQGKGGDGREQGNAEG